jgi:hypothetical protein
MATNLNAILAAAGEAGAMTAKGSDGMMFLGKIVFQGAIAKVVKDGKNGNVKEVYKAYLTTATQSEYGSKVKLDNDKALKFGVSKLSTFCKFAALKGAKADTKWDLVRQVVRVVNEDASKKDGGERRVVSRYEQVLKVLRVANKDGKAKFSDTAVREALAPKVDETVDPILRVLENMLAKAVATREGVCVGAHIVKGAFFQAVEATLTEQIDAYKAKFAVDVADDADLSPDEDEDDADHDVVESDDEIVDEDLEEAA